MGALKSTPARLIPQLFIDMEMSRVAWRSLRRGAVYAGLLMACTCRDRLWEGPARQIDFKRYHQANRIVACGRVCPSPAIATIEDSARVRYAVDVVKRYSNGWRDSWNAPGGGVLNLVFYNGQDVIGTFGITPAPDRQVMISVGTLSRRAPSDDMLALIDRLGVQWPDKWPPK